ncbi:flavodoxin domain-containing protein [Geodermatophilus marinus]|uniref:flavodoxin domain-containing protein n=1 Tax=Geodermatophilus sp. LHW52908 TaxID=2303986 RepID=UPI000E3D06BC|nr:flavodoxin domain-containing protein [Geodermatophilus sp. LHW52908]RFU20478.1 flavodoxin [Geodermatophilus sp. LHW52908]
MERTRVLVAYATAAGSTRGIADRIADRLREVVGDAAEVVVRPADPELDVRSFDAVVLGSAVHDMAWLPAATHLLRRARVTLGDRPLWCFSVAGVAPRDPVRRLVTDRELQRVERGFPSGLAPRDHRLFGGVVVLRGMPLWGRLFWLALGGRPGDHRDWAAVDRWADGIAAALPTVRRAASPAGDERPAARGTSAVPPAPGR